MPFTVFYGAQPISAVIGHTSYVHFLFYVPTLKLHVCGYLRHVHGQYHDGRGPNSDKKVL